MEEEEKYRIIRHYSCTIKISVLVFLCFRHQMLKRRRNAEKILRHTDVYYCFVVGRLDLDLE